ncbi:hypothetical protein JTE90_000281 [Oedothorax gibbosus]|uniref:Uncharacterized protein n=1 Tax=Oedothorax gibbosus TaxID=931172 RepID=A0AAV6VUB5_9ARAC|nr:hypothetical protein JTE90_000281 [Oedothorax gibbosus]
MPPSLIKRKSPNELIVPKVKVKRIYSERVEKGCIISSTNWRNHGCTRGKKNRRVTTQLHTPGTREHLVLESNINTQDCWRLVSQLFSQLYTKKAETDLMARFVKLRFIDKYTTYRRPKEPDDHIREENSIEGIL